ncbi:MAG: AAA family ATPase [Bacteroidales bacterium]|nr:AAA family ATPase [Bacteroidales bacterium]
MNDFWIKRITQALGFPPTASQETCIQKLAQFLSSHDERRTFVLNGYAGTGKTSLMSALVTTLTDLSVPIVLLAPTGRAAKVLAAYSHHTAYSIHRYIYRQCSAYGEAFELSYNRLKNAVFIIDEASMISSQNDGGIFGSGSLLDDLIDFVYQGEGCTLILVGDTAQLLPVTQGSSPALDKDFLTQYYLNITTHTLSDVVRQTQSSGILTNATLLRKAMQNNAFPTLLLNGFSDVKRVSGEDLIDTINSAYDRFGIEECTIITRSNKRATLYNRGIRAQVLQNEDELSHGDRLMVIRNDYFWTEQYAGIDFIANGDIATIIRLHNWHELYNLHFVEATLQFADYDMEIDTMLLIDSLYADTPTEVEKLRQHLFCQVEEDYMHIASKRERYKAMRQDRYLNALNVKFAYAVTCHKAQGGQWDCVFVDFGIFNEEQLDYTYWRWLYTAFTRSKQQIYLVNFIDRLFEKKPNRT